MEQRIRTLENHINKVDGKIAKLERVIANRKKKIAYKEANVGSFTGEDLYWERCAIRGLIEDNRSAEKKIVEQKAIRKKHVARLVALKKDALRLAALMDKFEEFIQPIVASWNEFDIKARTEAEVKNEEMYAEIRAIPMGGGHTTSRKEIRQKYEYYDFGLIGLTDEQIFKRNKDAGIKLLLDLETRIAKKVGEIEDWAGLHINRGNDGLATLNGTVKGTKGQVKVRSIYAGGYNIQRLHIRTLVNSV